MRDPAPRFCAEARRYMLTEQARGFVVASKIDAVLKLSVVAALLLASSGIAYYYAVYLPGRDARLELERLLAETQAYAQKRAEEQRLRAEHEQLQQRQAEAKAGADANYQTCLDRASATHDTSWAQACKRLSDQALEEHSDCLAKSKLSQVYCDASYRTRDASAHCTLPVGVATELDGNLTMARNRCKQERNAALQ